jgi:hypothetical protein
VTASREAPARRAARLLRWYPPSWRARYGEEFTELLIAGFAEQPRSARRSIDVARGGLVARLAATGLSGHRLEPAEQARAALATAACSMAAFLAFGIAMWAQLTIGWEWSSPPGAATRFGMVAMSAATALLAVLGLAAALPLAWIAVRSVACQRGGRLRVPALLALTGALVLAVGSHHFQNGWPGTGAAPWAQQGLVPGGVAAFSWAATLSFSSYWAHPAALAAFPAAEIAWMAVSPLALAALAAGIAGILRRLDLSPRLLRYETWLASAAGVGMAVFVVGGGCWVLAGSATPGLFHAGAIDIACLAVMMLALSVARLATGRAWRSAPGPRPPY